MIFSNILIKASAGSGKTFQLSNRYLQLLFNGVAPETILATTFTRKAAGEILERILERLADAVFDDEKRRLLSQFVISDNHDGRTISRSEMLAMLSRVVRQMHRLRVSTLDSFFQQIASNLSLELDMPPGWLILEDDDRSPMLIEGIRLLLERLGKKKTVELMHLLFKGEIRARVTQEINTLMLHLAMVYTESIPEAWQRLHRAKEMMTSEIKALARDMAVADIATIKTGGPNKKMLECRDSDLRMIRSALEKEEPVNWQAIGEKGMAAKVLNHETMYQRGEMPDSLIAVYEQIVRQVRATVINRLATQTEAMGALLGEMMQIVDELKYQKRMFDFSDVTLRLARATLDEQLEQIVHRIDANTSHLLLDEFQDTSPYQWQVLKPFAKRIISIPQEQKGVQNIRSQTNTDISKAATSFFCVGDIKQAIYGWRGGVAEIFDAIETDLGMLEEQRLDTSYRSCPAVIETVNKVFGSIAVNAALNGDETKEAFYEAAINWQRRFELHETSRKNLKGYCSLITSVLPIEETNELGEAIKPTAADKERAHLRYVIDKIESLYYRTPTATIGVLTRTNDTIRKIIFGLKQKGIAASEEGGNRLDQSPAVELILSALSLVDYPGNRIARYHIANSVLSDTLQITLDNFYDDTEMQRAAHRIRKCLVAEGYVSVLHDWVSLLAPVCDKNDLDKLIQLLEMASVYQKKAKIRTMPFINLVRIRAVENPSAASIRVMSIHKSKGLQFDIVVLPELDEKLAGAIVPKVITDRENVTGPITTVLAYPGTKIRKYLPLEYQQMVTHFEAQLVEETLCVLYVGMTRSIHELLMIVKPKEESAKKPSKKDDETGEKQFKFPGTMAGVLHAGLKPETPLLEDVVVFSHGEHHWIDAHFPASDEPGAIKDKSDAKHIAGIFDFYASDRDSDVCNEGIEIRLAETARIVRKNLIRVTPSSQKTIFDGTLVKPKFYTMTAASRENPGMLWGTALHACFEQVTWIDQQLPEREKLLDIVNALVQGKINATQVVDRFFNVCQLPEIRAVLSHVTYRDCAPVARNDDVLNANDGGLFSAVHRSAGVSQPYWEVQNERRFSVMPQQGILIQGSIDRLTLLYDCSIAKRKVVGADIIDFKSDQTDSIEGLNERIVYYAPQLLEYRKAVSAMFQLDDTQISTRLLFVNDKLGKVFQIYTA